MQAADEQSGIEEDVNERIIEQAKSLKNHKPCKSVLSSVSTCIVSCSRSTPHPLLMYFDGWLFSRWYEDLQYIYSCSLVFVPVSCLLHSIALACRPDFVFVLIVFGAFKLLYHHSLCLHALLFVGILHRLYHQQE